MACTCACLCLRMYIYACLFLRRRREPGGVPFHLKLSRLLPTGGATSLAGYYFSAGEASQAPAASAGASAATGKEAGKHFVFDPQLYAQVAAARASNGMAPPVAAPSMHHARWNAHFGHPPPKKKEKAKVVQPATCEVCKVNVIPKMFSRYISRGKKHKKNLEKLQDSITPKPVKPANNAVGANVALAAVANSMVPAVQEKRLSNPRRPGGEEETST